MILKLKVEFCLGSQSSDSSEQNMQAEEKVSEPSQQVESEDNETSTSETMSEDIEMVENPFDVQV